MSGVDSPPVPGRGSRQRRVSQRFHDALKANVPVVPDPQGQALLPGQAGPHLPGLLRAKREVEIDCPGDCVYLHSGREYERSRRARLGDREPLTARLWDRSFQARHMELLTGLWSTIHESRAQSPDLVDGDVREVLERLARTYRTLEGGIYYDHVPDTLTQKVLYGSLKSLLDKRQKPEDLSASTPKTGDVLDCLQMTLEMANLSDLSRPRSREFLDRLATMVSQSAKEPSRLESSPKIVLP